jgi:TolB-like protein
MATVYLARDLRHDRRVALKLLRPEFATTLGPERFLSEIRVTARLQHPHILPLLDSGVVETGNRVVLPYYIMPYVDGESLRHRLLRDRQLPVEESVKIAVEVAAALAYAHSKGVVHRDIKPENILLSGDQPMLADFGIARALSAAGGERLTETGLAMGTPQYMSPEQASGDPSVHPSTDIYALGCVLYEMLAGRPPFTGRTVQAVIARHIAEPVPQLFTIRNTVPEVLERAIRRALAKAPADRFASADEFALAISESLGALSRRRWVGRRWRSVAVVIGGLAVGSGLAYAWPRTAGPRISPSASLIAVLPSSPSGADTALSRLGRDLVFTLSAELDGLGGIRVVDAHTVLAQARNTSLYSVGERAALARHLGAGSTVQGSLVREGPRVRLDFVLLPTDTGAAPLARGSVTGAPDSIAALTDSAARVLLGQIWARGPAPTPSLDVALKTRSVPALRAFLSGEGEMVGANWDSAAASYGRAIEADPEFWLAYARFVFARIWSLEDAPDSVMARLARHRFELPDRERLMTEAIMLRAQDSVALSLERAQEVSRKYPDSWFGWLIYADGLLHDGPLLGYPLAEARPGFERAVALNPNLIPGWEHLTLLALMQHDTAAANRSIGELVRLDAGPALSADGYGNRLLQFRFLEAIERGDGVPAHNLLDSIARDPEPAALPSGTFYDPLLYGLFDQQMRVSQAGLGVWSAPARRAAQYRLIALTWLARGGWDSSLAVLDRLSADGSDSAAALRSYGLAVVGAWLGALDPREAATRRGAALAEARSDSSDQAEAAWLDGVAAYTQGDRNALQRARSSLRAWEGSASTPLARSLGAFAEALDGSKREAGETLERLEWEEAANGARGFAKHPFTILLDRIAAARWLRATGEADRAERLLTFVEGPFLLHPSNRYNVALRALVDLERARIEEGQGHPGLASRYYREFVARYDRAMPSHRDLVEEATTGVARLESAIN